MSVPKKMHPRGKSAGSSASRPNNRPAASGRSEKNKTKRRPKRNPVKKSPTAEGVQRLNKILAAAGLGSRREVEELILQGRVEIEREIVTDLAFKADPRTIEIRVDGQVLKRPKHVYYALNKPTGVLSTSHDPSGRLRVIDFVPDKSRVFCVGRLDRSSEGLILLTNDGDLAQKLAHPKYSVSKTYFVVVAGRLTEDELNKLRKGVYLAEGFARIDGAKIRKFRKGATELEITLSEGKNREIRRILARAGHKVVMLRRLSIGPLKLGQLPTGASRELTSKEVAALYAVSDARKREAKDSGSTKSRRTKPRAATEPLAGKPQPAPLPSGNDETPDFGFLDQSAPSEIELPDEIVWPEANDGQFTLPDEPADEFGEFDDDFVGGFSAGSVLTYEGTVEEQPKNPKKKARGGGASRTGRSKSAGSRSKIKSGAAKKPTASRGRRGKPGSGGSRANAGTGRATKSRAGSRTRRGR